MDHHTRGRYFIYTPKQNKENQLLSLEHFFESDINEVHGKLPNILLERMSLDRNILGSGIDKETVCPTLISSTEPWDIAGKVNQKFRWKPFCIGIENEIKIKRFQNCKNKL